MTRTKILAVLLALSMFGAVTVQGAALPGVTAQQEAPDGQQSGLVVESITAPDSAEPGSTVTVVAEVSNPGSARTTQEVEFRLGGDVLDRRLVTLDGGENTTVRFEADTEDLDPGEYRHGVYTGANSQTATLVLSESFEITDFDAPDSVEAGDLVTVDVELENPNDFETTQNVSFWFDGSRVASEAITIDDGDDADVTFNLSSQGVAPGTYEHGVFTRDEGELAEIEVTEPGPTNASVAFEDQESDGTTVTVDQLVIPSDGYVVIHDDSLLEGNVVGSVIGVSEYLEEGTYQNVNVTLYEVEGADFNETELTESGTLIAMPHNETTGDETYDFVASNGTDDGPFTLDGQPVTDDATVTVAGANETSTPVENATAENETAAPADNETEAPPADNETAAPTASVTLDDQTSDGTSVTVTDISLSEGGYVVIHDDSLLDGDAAGSVVGVSEYLEPGEYDELTIPLFDVPGATFDQTELTENQTLIAMPHLEDSGNQTYDFVTSGGSADAPYVDDEGAVTDAGNVTVAANETAG
ncbi:DUF7282 domain-containing protein [Haloarcula amylovorans]|uniref:DUF7282 domain-containing protein n=1 Tax=Haloarcula amylovorans TaxID=2562280 RepID=UPI001076B63E|nr:CARDB domain-containing protein [Halomicroarcula amylolytica]